MTRKLHARLRKPPSHFTRGYRKFQIIYFQKQAKIFVLGKDVQSEWLEFNGDTRSFVPGKSLIFREALQEEIEENSIQVRSKLKPMFR